MTSKTIHQTLDDIDGREGATGHTFALDGVTYAIDLHADNHDALTKTLADFIDNARRVGKVKLNGGGHVVLRATTNADTRIIRQWWREQGTVGGASFSERGRVPQVVVAAFRAQQGAAAPAEVPTPAGEPVARANGRSKPVPEDLASTFAQGGSIKAVADHYGVSYPTAQKWVRGLK